MPLQIKELCPAFNKIRKLSVCGIFVDFDIEWTIAFLEAAPSIELLLIGVTSVVSVL
jgi:predicted aspartyl protease